MGARFGHKENKIIIINYYKLVNIASAGENIWVNANGGRRRRCRVVLLYARIKYNMYIILYYYIIHTSTVIPVLNFPVVLCGCSCNIFVSTTPATLAIDDIQYIYGS